MIKFRYTGWQALTIMIEVETSSPQKIVIKASNEAMANTYFTNRSRVVTGRYRFYVQMPVSGNLTKVEVYNEANGNVDKDSSFKVLQITKVPLIRKLDVVDFKDPQLKAFIKFCTRFCFYAGVMPAGTYNSPDGRFVIVYSEQILNSKTGEVLGTPARINKDTGQIEIARTKFIPMTVPMRMAILLHEFAHFFINQQIDNETEADLNALLIYLGLGYPRIEACEAFLDVFINSANGPNPLNEQQKAANSRRYNINHKFIQNFEKNNFLLKE